ncbi:MAG: nitrogenase component 1 [bacterium]
MRKVFDNAKLAQHACLLEGLCICLARTGGDFAVIIHSYRDCANILPRGVPGYSSDRFFCTNLRESDVMAGSTMERLSECVRLVAELENPAAIYVFGSCLSELIGDDIENGLAEAAEEISMPVIAVTSSGLDDISPKKVVDRHADLMYRAASAKAEPIPFSVNLIGFPPDGGEIAGILAAAGIEVNAGLSEKSPMPEWLKLPRGSLNAVLDKSLFSIIIEKMKNEHGIPTLEVPLPIGVSGTDDFFMGIAAHFKKNREMKEAIRDKRKAAAAAVSSRAEEWNGMKIAYNIGTEREYNHHITAKSGLCEVGFFRELNFDVTLLIQGSPEPRRRFLVSRQLREMGIDAGFDIFVDNVSMASALRKAKFNLVYCVEAMAEIVRPTKVPLIGLGSMRTGYGGCLFNLELIAKTLSGRRE